MLGFKGCRFGSWIKGNKKCYFCRWKRWDLHATQDYSVKWRFIGIPDSMYRMPYRIMSVTTVWFLKTSFWEEGGTVNDNYQQRMHRYRGNPSRLPYNCLVWFTLKIQVPFNNPLFWGWFHHQKPARNFPFPIFFRQTMTTGCVSPPWGYRWKRGNYPQVCHLFIMKQPNKKAVR